jgi:hypothetical protein
MGRSSLAQMGLGWRAGVGRRGRERSEQILPVVCFKGEWLPSLGNAPKSWTPLAFSSLDFILSGPMEGCLGELWCQREGS